MNIYEEAGKAGKDAMDNALRSLSAMSLGFQQLAAETSDFTKRSYEQSSQAFGQLAQVRSLEKAVELQNEFAKSAYQAWVSQATKVGEICSDMARESYKPFETALERAASFGKTAAAKTADEAQQAAA
ncbi:phasin family protein [Mangrovicella endophytica]|uniref:phasin family protein n=1 Tax=Mangrovicella endophytica TaxID=2066697 RepID=UPI000C9E13CD|nr:phasin family protein [Mangrovicella endophytica]